MDNNWNSSELNQIVSGTGSNPDLAHCIYVSRVVGRVPNLVIHGGGNTSVKTSRTNILGETETALYVKASGFDLAEIDSNGFAAIDLSRALKLRSIPELSQEDMVRQLRLLLLDPDASMPSVEAFLHAFIPSRFIVHTHPISILALTNQKAPEKVVRKILGNGISTVPYIRAGFGLAQAVADAFEKKPDAEGMILLQHGLVTWGETAEDAYNATIRIVTAAEQYWNKQAGSAAMSGPDLDLNLAWERYTQLAPLVRGLLAEPSGDSDKPHRRFVLAPLINREVLNFLSKPEGLKLAVSEPLTPDHLIRTKAYPLLLSEFKNPETTTEELRKAIQGYAQRYNEYFDKHKHRLASGAQRLDPMPRVLLIPGTGVICAGIDEKAAIVARDITAQSLEVKRWFAQSGIEYHGIGEEHLFEMEYLLMQQAKLRFAETPLQRQVAVITGAVGAIGMGITETLLRNGCHVALTDLPGENLENTAKQLAERYPHRVHSAPMDVTDVTSVRSAFHDVIRRWGGVDLLILNAGIAMVSSLAEMDLERFRALERVNVEGTLLVLREATEIFSKQNTGGDVILVSTKNVFAPGAKFGAYSATKAAAHQLARIASLELAELDVRVNMVAPDAVFSHGQTRSGLWAEVGPDRMKARGLTESGLEDYYRNRNLLKASVTAEHVGRAVLFFATRQTPTTGATIPVDGGLPDSTPR